MKTHATLATALLLASAGATAAGSYAGLAVGTSRADYGTAEIAPFNDGSFTRLSADNAATAVSLFIGADITPNVAVEVAYSDLGRLGIGAVSDGTGPVFPAGRFDLAAEVSAFSLAMTAQAPLGERVHLLARVGMARWDANLSGHFNGVPQVTSSASGTDPVIGLGLGLTLGDALRLQLEATRYRDIGGYDTDVLAAALVHRFP